MINRKKNFVFLSFIFLSIYAYNTTLASHHTYSIPLTNGDLFLMSHPRPGNTPEFMSLSSENTKKNEMASIYTVYFLLSE